ncbi:PREDICTED: protein FAM228B, partial [Merops nubicus]|uniref:protein FAM228B n=1 Tax=Merops nubicus TaxID=57421 RepID=UPI0004F039D9
GYVALEAYDPSEYDPFFLKRRPECWKVSTPALQDPLLKGLQRWFLEMGAVEQCEPGRPGPPRAPLPPLPLSRQRLDAAQWLKVPHAYIASEGRKTRR